MSYEKWLELIQEEHDPRYYHRLFQFSKEILEDAKGKGKTNYYMQGRLRINAQQWSTIKKMLQEFRTL